MPSELFDARVDMVDDTFWIETSVTRAATVQLHATLELARDPDVWMPFFCLSGPEASGKTALARRVARQAQRNVACRLAGEAVARGSAPDPHPTGREAETLMRARATADDFGHCPMVCNPMLYHPIDVCEMWVKPHGDRWSRGILRNEAITPGNITGDPLRRTSLVLIDKADHLLNLTEAKQRLVLDQLLDWPNRRFAWIFIGSSRLAETLARHGRTQLIPLPGLTNDAEFAKIVDLVFGTRDPADVARIHRASEGCMGALLHMAKLEGLAPPFDVPDEDILRLPARSQTASRGATEVPQ